MGTDYDISTTSDAGNSILISDKFGNLAGITFSDDGTYFYGVGYTNDKIHQYRMEPDIGVGVSTIEITLNIPENDSYTSKTTISFNASYDYTYLNKTNATFHIYNASGIFNQTIVTLSSTSNSTLLNISDFVIGNYHWGVYACGINATDTICNWNLYGNYTFNWVPFEINNQTYYVEVYETSRPTFTLNKSSENGVILYSED